MKNAQDIEECLSDLQADLISRSRYRAMIGVSEKDIELLEARLERCEEVTNFFNATTNCNITKEGYDYVIDVSLV